MKKKKVIVGFFIGIFVLGLIFWTTLSTSQLPPNAPTGAAEERISPQEELEVAHTTALKRRSPLETDAFRFQFDYQKNIFAVTLKSVSEDEFFLWLDENGYERIPRDKFVFTSLAE